MQCALCTQTKQNQTDFLHSILPKYETDNNSKAKIFACRNCHLVKWLCSSQMQNERKVSSWHLSFCKRLVAGPLALALPQQFEGKTMGDGVSATTLDCWNIGNPRNSRLAPRGEWFATPIEEWPILLNCIWSAGPVSKGSSIDMCGRPMNHFNGRSVAFHPGPPPSAAVFQGRQGEQIAQKAVDGKNCSHHTSKSLLSLYRGKKRGEVLGWPVGPVTGGQFVKQSDFGRAHCSAGGWRGGETNHDLQSHSGKLFNYFRLIVIASLGPVFKNENRNVHMAWNYSIQAPFCVMLFQRGACSSQASNERAKVMMKWVVNTWIPDRQAFVEIKLIFGQC